MLIEDGKKHALYLHMTVTNAVSDVYGPPNFPLFRSCSQTVLTHTHRLIHNITFPIAPFSFRSHCKKLS